MRGFSTSISGIVRSSPVIRSKCIGLIILCTVASARAEPFTVLDDFSDGNDVGWIHFTTPGVVGQWDASTGVYQMSSVGPVPSGDLVGSAYAVTTTDTTYSNGYFLALVRRDIDTSRTGILFRGTAQGFYFFSWGTGLGMYIGREDQGPPIFLASAPFTQNLGEWYFMEGGAVGSSFEMRMWAMGDPMPINPQVTITDSTYQTGAAGLFGYASPDGNIASSFDDFAFAAVPEPSSALLAATGLCTFGLCALVGGRRRSARQSPQ